MLLKNIVGIHSMALLTTMQHLYIIFESKALRFILIVGTSVLIVIMHSYKHKIREKSL